MSIVDSAKSYVGKVSYSFGASNVKGGVGDCSSFTQQVYKDNGVDIGRDTLTQWSKGQYVAKENLQAGDLVFFQGTYRKGVSHVGIYVGNGKFIHNSDGVGVTYGDLNNSYYKQHWLGGRRVAGVSGGSNATEKEVSEGKKKADANKITGSTVNPTYTAEEMHSGRGIVWENLASLIIMLLLAILALVFFMQIFGTPIEIVLNTATKKLTKGVTAE